MKLDILAIGVHPDDVELGCSGTVMKQIDLGYRLGTRGNADIRLTEVEASTKIMGAHMRENLGFEDGFFKNDKHHQLELVKMIRRYQPQIIFTNAKHDRHPDHGRAAELTYDACFLAGLSKIETTLNGRKQKAFRPVALYNYIQAIHAEPDFVVDISAYFERKMQTIKAFKSQFYNGESEPDSGEKQTFISSPEFMDFVKGRAIHFGVPIGVKYAEAFTVNRTLGVNDVMSLL